MNDKFDPSSFCNEKRFNVTGFWPRFIVFSAVVFAGFEFDLSSLATRDHDRVESLPNDRLSLE